MRRTSALTKTIASSCSIVLSAGLSVVLFGATLSTRFLVGATVVCTSAYLYATADGPPPALKTPTDQGRKPLQQLNMSSPTQATPQPPDGTPRWGIQRQSSAKKAL
jgi:hypothetical protein